MHRLPLVVLHGVAEDAVVAVVEVDVVLIVVVIVAGLVLVPKPRQQYLFCPSPLSISMLT